MIEIMGRDPGSILQDFTRLAQGGANDQGGGSLAQGPDFGKRRSADGHGGKIVVGQVAIQRIRDVGQEYHPQIEGLDQCSQLLQIPGCQAGAGQHIDLTLAGSRPGTRRFSLGNQCRDDFGHGSGIAGFEATGKVGRVHGHDGHVVVLGILGAKLPHAPLDVRSLGFRKSRGEHGNESGCGFFGDGS